MKTRHVNKLDDARTLMERFRLITVARYRDRSRVERASEEIDAIRTKSRRGSPIEKTIRKWRDTRYAPRS